MTSQTSDDDFMAFVSSTAPDTEVILPQTLSADAAQMPPQATNIAAGGNANRTGSSDACSGGGESGAGGKGLGGLKGGAGRGLGGLFTGEKLSALKGNMNLNMSQVSG